VGQKNLSAGDGEFVKAQGLVRKQGRDGEGVVMRDARFGDVRVVILDREIKGGLVGEEMID